MPTSPLKEARKIVLGRLQTRRVFIRLVFIIPALPPQTLVGTDRHKDEEKNMFRGQ